MSSLVELQVKIIAWLFRVVDTPEGADFLRKLLGFPDIEKGWMSDRLRSELSVRGLLFPTSHEEESLGYPSERALKIFKEQIDVSVPGRIVIRNLLGWPFVNQNEETHGIEEWQKNRGSGQNLLLRTDCCAQPRALRIGDVLVTGETVLKEPRQGENDQVLVCISDGDKEDHVEWLSFPSRTALALAPQDK